jgi:hypothetical protein
MIVFEHAVLGLAKADADCSATRSDLVQYRHVYEFPPELGGIARSRVLEHFGIQDSTPNCTITLLDMTEQGSPMSYNTGGLAQLIARSARFCDVEIVHGEDVRLRKVVELVSRTSVLIGRASGGLEHAVWLPPDGFVIELRPFKYWCNDRVKVAAEVAGARYEQVMSLGKFASQNPDIPKWAVTHCRSSPEYCASHECHAFLMNQTMVMELDAFNQTWITVLEQLKKKWNQTTDETML